MGQQSPVIRQQTLGTEHRQANYRQYLSSGQSVTKAPLNSLKKQRVLLPLEPDFNTVSGPNIVTEPPANTLESNWSASLKRSSRRDQPKSRRKKRKRYSSSSYSSSSSSLSSHRKSKKSKKSRHSHKKRRCCSSLSSSSESIIDYGLYQRQRHPSPQVVNVQTPQQSDIRL